MDTEYEIRGFYRPNFFLIYINGEFTKEFDQMSQKDLGTFVHEYTHYLQNVTTVFGLRNSIFYFRYFYEVKKYIFKNESFRVPLTDFEPTDSIKSIKQQFDFFRGSPKTLDFSYDKTSYQLGSTNFDDGTNHKTVHLLYQQGGRSSKFHIGNLAVKEGMARLCQKIYDPDVSHPTYPYCSIEHLAELINPKLLIDPRSIVALCILSLNSPNSGYTLQELMHNTKLDKDLDGRVLYAKYTNPDERWIVSNGVKVSIKEYLLESLKEFETHLISSLQNEKGIVHMNLLIENIKVDVIQGKNSILENLYLEDNKEIKLNGLLDFYGIPGVRSKSGTMQWPQDPNADEPAIEYLELMGQMLVFDRIVGHGDSTCGMYGICNQAENELTDHNCFGTQWNRGKECAFKMISDNWMLSKKIEN